MEREAVTPGVSIDASAQLRDFVMANYPRLVRLAILVSRSVEEAEDAVQAALERAWRSRASLEDPTKLKPWLDRIVVREAIRAGHRRPLTTAYPIREPAVAERSPEAVAVQIALGELSPEQRAAVVVHLHLGYSVADTAQILGVPAETVRSRLRVARERLRRLLAEEAET